MVLQSTSSVYHMGNSTLEVPMKLFTENRRRLLDKLKSKAPNSIVFLEGGQGVPHYNTDTEYPFRQEPFFHWLFGVTEPNFFGAIDVNTGKSYLFSPRPSLTSTTWNGKSISQEEYLKKYIVDFALHEDEIFATLSNLSRESLLVLRGTNTDSELVFKTPQIPSIETYIPDPSRGLSGFTSLDINIFPAQLLRFKVNYSILYPIMVELRVIKTSMEIEVLRYASKISSEAHKHVMKNIKPGMYEYQGEALFLYYIYNFGGCRATAYTCICGSGENSAILHYGHAGKPNDKLMKDGDFCLYDMGAAYYGYASDITVTFPVNGKFSSYQKIVYTAVMKARDAVYKNLGPGVYWTEMHENGIKATLSYLKEMDLLNSSVNEMFEAGLGAVFQPHGLGHLLGIDVHDVGGYTDETPNRPTKRGLHTLRTARKLQVGMVVTVEPGCYFIDEVLDAAFEDPLLNCFLADKVNEFRGIGGVRIEDVVLITESGYEILSNDLPRTIEEIENFMSSS